MQLQSNDNIFDMMKIFNKSAGLPAAQSLNSAALDAALHIVAHAHEEGMMMVPMAATQKMIEAARRVTYLPAEELQKIWRAMLQGW